MAIPLLFAVIFLLQKASRLVRQVKEKRSEKEAETLANYLNQLENEEIDAVLLEKKAAFDYEPPSFVTSEDTTGKDDRGLLNSVTTDAAPAIVAEKRKQRIDKKSSIPQGNIILWYIGCAVFWLLFGTTAGEYLGIKFVAPESDSVSWLSFGRLRPVHTNAVFWGWSSLAMLGLAYYVVPTVSNTPIASLKKGWASLILINASVVIGSICLMAGINNGGGEYREYIWPVMALFGAGLVLTLVNFIQTIARRKSREIYISNWYIVSALIFTLTIAFVAYWPTWQNGLGETIVQGYYMHQGVGMWFMLFNLGLVYYFLPQQVNKPIYSYGMGILAFWSQIIFYTLIGTHHFVFSSIPWWLQTVAIVGSAGMIIPVVAGTTNFFMTFKGSWNKLSSSYTLPFFFVGILFYFTGSLQGTAEAFRYTNLLWHFTDFTVAHSHLTMYGIIAFLLWGCIYVLVPRVTGKEPSQILTGIHFWMAFVGLMFYTIPLMIGGTLKGLSWMEGKFFIESVTAMAPFWLWRAIGGTLMWISHIIFAINFYKMVATSKSADVRELTIQKIDAQLATVNP
jgi:cytochrome c oxidase cbb3-type subunit 1